MPPRPTEKVVVSMRTYARPMVTMVELRIQEAVLANCKSLSQYVSPTAQAANLNGCYEPQAGSAGSEIFTCSAVGS